MKKDQGNSSKAPKKTISNRDFMKISLHAQQKKHYGGQGKHSNPLSHEPALEPYTTSYKKDFQELQVKPPVDHLDELRKQKDIRGKFSFHTGNPIQPLFDSITCTSTYQTSFLKTKEGPSESKSVYEKTKMIPKNTLKEDTDNTVKGLFDWPKKRTYLTSYDVEYIPPDLLEKFLNQN